MHETRTFILFETKTKNIFLKNNCACLVHEFYKNFDNENFFVSEKLAAAQRFSTKKASRTVGTTGAHFHKGGFTVRLTKKEKANSAFFLSFLRSFVQPTQVLSDMRVVRKSTGVIWEWRVIHSFAKQQELFEWVLEWSDCHSLVAENEYTQ